MFQTTKIKLLSLSFLCTLFLSSAYPAYALSTSAQSAILIEQESGRVLYEKNAHDPSLIASITKLLTALVAVEQNVNLDDMVEITLESTLMEGSSLYLQAGDNYTLETLLYGMLLHSGNDAATAIAIHCGGSVENFVSLMNQKAVELNMTNSLFANPHGLNDENHYSTAYDMALVAQACLENEIVAEIVATPHISIGGRSFTNKNKLLTNYEGCIGLKTGYTELAGRTLVSAATQDDMTLICVTLDAPDDWLDHSTLFDYGFQTYEMTEISPEAIEQVQIPLEHNILSFVPAGLDASFRYPIKSGETISYNIEVQTLTATAPIQKNSPVNGKIHWFLNETELDSSPLVYLSTIENCISETQRFQDKIQEKFTEFVEKLWLG